jgi:hypothetical protein
MKTKFRTIGSKFRMIEDDDVTVIVPYTQEGQDAIDAFEKANAGIQVQSDLFKMMQRYTAKASLSKLAPSLAAGTARYLDQFDLYVTDNYDVDIGIVF